MPTTRGAHRDFAALEARRFQAARLFGRGVAQVTVARELGVSRTTTHRWYYAWQAEGRRGLKAVGRAGRKPRLDRQQWAQVGAARPDPRPAPHRVELETVVDRRRARVSVGWSPHPLVLSNPPGHVYRHDAHPLRARPEATLPRSAGHAHLGWPRCAQESPHGALPRGPAALVAGRTVAGLCPGAQSRRIALG